MNFIKGMAFGACISMSCYLLYSGNKKTAKKLIKQGKRLTKMVAG